METQKSREVSLDHDLASENPALNGDLNKLLQAIVKKGDKPNISVLLEKINNPTIQGALQSLTEVSKLIKDQKENPEHPTTSVTAALEQMVNDFNALNDAISPKEQINNFYNDANRLDDLWEQAQKLKGDGERVTSKDIHALLLKGNDDDKALAALLSSKEHEQQSKGGWETFKEKKEKNYNMMEIVALGNFLENLDPQDFADPDKTVKDFHKKHPEFSGGDKKAAWFKAELEKKRKELEPKWLDEITNFYKTPEFKTVYNQLSTKLGKAPEWSDVKAELAKDKKNDRFLFLAGQYEKHSTAEWNQTWATAKEKFESFERQELDSFTKELKPKDWEDLDALAQRFQKTHERFSGSDRLAWYTEELKKKKTEEEGLWKQDLDNFYVQTLPALYAQAQQNLDQAPQWQDIRKLISDPDLLYVLENNLKTESENRWTAFWQKEKAEFNETEERTANQFIENLAPRALDNPAQIAAQYEADTRFKGNDWFHKKLNAHTEKEKTRLETEHQQVVSNLPDSDLANAMHRGYLAASNFAERSKWFDENKAKVSQYNTLINANTQEESRLTQRVNTHPDLKKELGKIKGEYQEGKKNYTENFYSPRKYSQALNALSEKMAQREALVESTISKAENRTFSQIPKLTDKKKLDYDEFRDALKKLNFYEIDPSVRKNEKVRAALRNKTQALHQQWLDHRMLHIEQNNRTQVETSQRVIRDVKLPKNLPPGITTMADFTLALKDAEVYAALPAKMLKNEGVRKSAHEHNLKLFAAYQAAQSKESPNSPTLSDPENIPAIELAPAKRTIGSVKLDDRLQSQIDDRLKGKDPANPNVFTVALREIGVYKGVDASLWQNPELRELAWQQNMKLQTQYLAKAKETEATKEENENLGLPGHYKFDWKGLNARLSPSQKKTGLERFKQLHSRSDIGLQTLMQQFNAPLGTFVMEMLAVMPKDRFDKAVIALKDTRIEAGKRDQASAWMKVLCESAGLDYLQKETATSWSQFRQKFSTHFGQSLDKAWEVELPPEPSLEEQTKEHIDLILSEEETPLAEESPEQEIETEVETTPELIVEDDLVEVEAEPELTDLDTEAILESIEDETDDDEIIEAPIEAQEIIEPVIDEVETIDDETFTTDTELAQETETLFETEIDTQAEPEISSEELDDAETETVLFDTVEEEDTDLEKSETIEDELEAEDPLPEIVDDYEADIETQDLEAEVSVEVIVIPPAEVMDKAENQEDLQATLQKWLEAQAPITTEQQDQIDAERGYSEDGAEMLDDEHAWLEDLQADEVKAALAQSIKEHSAGGNKLPHFFTQQYQEQHMASSMTVVKFLQELKSYCAYSLNLEAAIKHKPTGQELEAPQAEALFEAFANRLHQSQNITALTLGFKNNKLIVHVVEDGKLQVWEFKRP